MSKEKGVKAPKLDEVMKRYEAGFSFNQQIGLYDTVKINEDFFIGNQWEGVEANGLPTPTFNFLKQVVECINARKQLFECRKKFNTTSSM